MKPINYADPHNQERLKLHRYTVSQCDALTKDISKILLQSPQRDFLSYQAGQYIQVVHQDNALSPLSIACAPNRNGIVELHLSHAENNFLAQDILRMIREEGQLTFTGPFGSCTVDRLSLQDPIIFLARGTGFAPIKAVIEVLQKQATLPPIHLYWSATYSEDLYLQELAWQWTKELAQFSFTPLLSRANNSWQGKIGFLQQVILQDYPDLTGYQVYASAPANIVFDAWYVFEQQGLKRGNFFSDMF